MMSVLRVFLISALVHFFCLPILSKSHRHHSKHISKHHDTHRLSPDRLQSYVDETIQKHHPSNIRHRRFEKIDQVMCRFMGCEENEYSTPRVSHDTNISERISTRSVDKYEADLEKGSSKSSWSKDQENEFENQNFTKEEEELSSKRIAAIRKSRHNTLQGIQIAKSSTFSPQTINKFDEMGSEEKTNQRFLKYYNTLPKTRQKPNQAQRDAEETRKTMDSLTKCEKPLSVVINIKDEHQLGIHKKYTPEFIRLHRCSNLSGCCSEFYKCTVKKQENITLTFHIMFRENGEVTFETLVFTNHTRCGCVLDERFLSIKDSMQSDEKPRFQRMIPTCKCPYPFSQNVVINRHCICNCFDGDEECMKYKSGEHVLPKEEIRCVNKKECSAPQCSNGKYLYDKGRCPPSRKKVPSWINF